MFNPHRAKWLFIGSIVMVFAFSPEWAQSEGNLKWGPLEIHPFVQVTLGFDDNVCRSNSGDCLKDDDLEEGSDIVTVINPGLQVTLPLRNHSLQLKYQGNVARYGTFEDENFEDHSFEGLASLNFAGGLYIQGKELWVDGHDPRGFSQNIEPDFYTQNTASVSIGKALVSKLGLEIRYRNFSTVYEDERNEFRDRTDSTVGGGVFYHVFPKTSVLVEYNFTEVAFDNEEEGFSRDSTVHQASTGVQYELTVKSKGTLKGGYEKKKFEESSRSDFNGGIFTLDLEYELTPRALIQLTGERGSRESNLESEDYFVTTGVSLKATQRFSRRLMVLAEAGFIRDQYPDREEEGEGRRDETFRIRLGVDYWLRKWLNTNARYEHSLRNSTEREFEYTDNLYSMSVGIVF